MDGVSPVTLGFLGSPAAGAMMYVISREIIPQAHRSGHQNKATLGFSMKLVIMLFLNVSTRARWDAQEVIPNRERLCGLPH
ncbi:hypothetical protein BCL93_11633 [Onishia taeanensis]|jgi:zinc transporter ZupT|uniref:Uncharacterized protein n=1 Tax=Onishia taeanensis TaxID=284577 RepID=A0A328XE58_9GAMM|nr:hypothetical protein BCL93_11633 [Halomonas taeanensis]